jgi:hypothetical protein
MRTILAIGALAGLTVLPAAVPAAPMDGSAPILCALNSVMECARRGECERSTAEDAQVPPFVRVDVPRRLLSSVDGARTSPIASTQRTNGRLMIQGMQNERVWGAVINEETGYMWATIGEDDGAIVISGACVAP